MGESYEHRIKRLKIRSWRRGIKEMDMILGPFSDTELVKLTTEQLDLYESLLAENDQDLYMWMSGRVEMPPEHAEIGLVIRKFIKLA